MMYKVNLNLKILRAKDSQGSVFEVLLHVTLAVHSREEVSFTMIHD